MSTVSDSVQLKASFYTITVLQLNKCSLKEIDATLKGWVANTPQLLQGMPIIIDFSMKHQKACDLESIVNYLRYYGLVPIGIQGGEKDEQDMARKLHLAVFSGQKRDANHSKVSVDRNNIKPTNPLPAPTIIQSVRSGQQIHVKGDLIILHSVSIGAEVSAEGNIHIYGTLAGRAFAGSAGNKKACIFCHKIEAELVAIAGCYWQYDDLQKSLDKNNIQIYLANETLNIRLLG